MGSLDAVDDLCMRGAFVDAWQRLASVPGELRTSVRAKLIEARLLHHLGAPRRARRESARLYRQAPDDPYARSGMAFERMSARGAVDALDWLRRNPIVTPDGPADDGLVADAFELELAAFTTLRDFTAAKRVADRWRERGVRPADRVTYEAHLLERADRFDEAVALARREVREHPRARRLTMMTARLLVASGEPHEAVALLRESVDVMQASSVAEMLYAVALAHDEHALVAHALGRLVALVPEAEPEVKARIAFMQAEAAYRRGDVRAALEITESLDDDKMRALSERLRAATPDARRVVLDVPFVRQEHLGCAPATLAALSRYFGRAADHVELADRMCYHGTPAHAERSWAESHGFVAREMRLTWDVARSLVRRSIPFHVTTFVPGAGHAQALMGIDERRRSFIFRDPSVPLPIEVDADSFLEELRHCGPRCLVIIPAERAAELDGVVLPDAELYDELYEVERALAVHDRPRAAAACARLVARAPSHQVTRAARRALAAYDDDPFAIRTIAEAALAEDADDRLARLDLVLAEQVVAPRARRLEVLEEAARRGRAPIFLELLATELSTDGRERPRAKRLARRALASQHESSRAVYVLASIAWAEGDAAFAVEAFRFAACLEPTNDERVRAYAFAARRIGRHEEALALVREVNERLGPRGAAPALLLADVLDEVGDAKGAGDALAAALERRPDDGHLLLAASRRAAAEGKRDEARSLLERARGKIEDAAWARGAAILATVEAGSEDEQLTAWRRVADVAPLAMDAQTQVANLLRRTKGYRAAVEHLASRAERFPHHRPTVRAYLEALRNAAPDRRIEALRRFLATEPADAWGRRELALALALAHRHDEALLEVHRAAELDARAVELHRTRAFVAEQRSDLREARAAYLEALDVEADAPFTIVRLVETTPPGERSSLLEQLFERAERRAVSMDTFDALYSSALPHVSPEWLGAALARLRETRAEIAAVWLLSIRHALATRPGEAHALVSEALSRFPLVPEVHLEAADAFSVAGEVDRAVQHLERAVALGPHLPRAVARLVNQLEARGERERVDALLEDVRRRAQFDATIALERVRVLARRGELLGAVEALESALDREPDLEAAWSLLTGVASSGAEVRERALEASARLAEAHPWSASTQSSRAFLLLDAGRPADALATVEAAVRRGLVDVELRDARATALAMSGRTEEALAACAPGPDEVLPPSLGFRAAWIHAYTGDVRRAISVLRDVLAANGSFLFGWQRLVDWCLEVGEPKAAVDAATRVVALAPMLSSSQQVLGGALLAAGDRAGARAAFERALERDPGNVVAAAQLFRLAADARDAKTVASAMAVLARRVEPHERAAFDVEVALVNDDLEGALERFSQACTDSATKASTLGEAWDALRRWKRAAEGTRVLERLVVKPEATEAAGAVWMRAAMSQDWYDFGGRLRELPPRSPVARGAVAELFSPSSPVVPIELKRILRELRDWLAAGDDETWAAPLVALVAKKLYGLAVSWGRSWRTRPGVPHGDLYTLSIAFHAAGLPRHAMEIARAVAPRASDVDARSFHAWIAFDETASGRPDRAEAELALAEGEPVHGVALFVRQLARHLVTIQRASDKDRFGRYVALRDELDALLRESSAYPSLADVARRTRWRLARDLLSVAPLRLGAERHGFRPPIVGLVVVTALARLAPHSRAAGVVVAVLLLGILAWLVWPVAARAARARYWLWFG